MIEKMVTGREFARQAECDVKQVQRAIKAGKLKTDANGKLDISQLSTGWRKPIRSSRAIKNPAPVIDLKDEASEITLDLAGAICKKENYLAELKKLEFEKKSGELIEMSVARQVFFEEARASRDAWLGFPAKVGPLIAADLDIDAAKVIELLLDHVHAQIAQLGNPDPDFSDEKK